jgi:hypothetical protein
MFNKLFTTVAIVLIFFGIIMIAGSANDCDGKCVETANTLGQMATLVGIGLAMIFTGSTILYNNSK